MTAKGIVIAEECHVVNILPPIDLTGGVTGDVFTMKDYSHVTIIVQIGVSAAAPTKIIINECNTIAGGAANAIAHAIYIEETAAGDTLGSRTEVLAAGTTPSANDNIFYVIELDAAALAEGFNFVQLSITDGGNATLASAIAILSGARYQEAGSRTAIL